MSALLVDMFHLHIAVACTNNSVPLKEVKIVQCILGKERKQACFLRNQTVVRCNCEIGSLSNDVPVVWSHHISRVNIDFLLLKTVTMVTQGIYSTSILTKSFTHGVYCCTHIVMRKTQRGGAWGAVTYCTTGKREVGVEYEQGRKEMNRNVS